MDKKLYNAMLEDMKRHVAKFYSDFADDPANLSGWGHDYFCEEDGGRLIFDLNSTSAHKCPICGHLYTAEKYNKTWTYLYRMKAFMDMTICAHLYKETHDVCFLDYIVDTLNFYTDNYNKFPIHSKGNIILNKENLDTTGVAKIMPQGLNEAIMLVRSLSALHIAGNDLSRDFLVRVKTNLFAPAIDEVLAPQLNMVHNIKCWINSAIGMAGIFFNEDRWIRLAFDGEYGIRRQLKEGVTTDGFWFEGSIHYNFFTLEGIANLMYFCKVYDHPFGEEAEIVKKMLHSAYDYSFDDGAFPNPNDGWPDINLKTYLSVYYLAALSLPEDIGIWRIVQDIEALEIKRTPLPLCDTYYFGDIPIERLLVVSHASKRESTNFASSNFGILRSGYFNLFLKYGHNSPSHAHPDAMTFELQHNGHVITRDLSNAGYGAKICNEWHRTSASHNTVVAGGQSHTKIKPGRIIDFSGNRIKAEAEAYDGIKYVREFNLTKDSMRDEFWVYGTKETIYDYFLHFDQELTFTGKTCDASLGFNENGYQHIKNIVSVNCRELIVFAGNNKLILTVNDGEIFLCDTLNNPVTSYRKTLVIRKKGRDVKFCVEWKVHY